VKNDQELQKSCFAVIAPFVAKTDAAMSVIKIGNTTISTTPFIVRTTMTKNFFRNFTEQQRYKLRSKQ